MTASIADLDASARSFLTLSGRMRQRGLDKGEMDVLSVLYLAHEGISEGDVNKSLGRLSAGRCLRGLALLKLAAAPDGKWLITRRGRDLLAEVLAS